MTVDLAKQIEVLKTHPDYEEVVRSIGFGARANTLIVLLHNGNWFELEFSEREPEKVYVSYWQIAKPNAAEMKLFEWLQDKHTRN